ncbi:hypothetical protein K2173_016234 [Erythroxylum novogranatense]|uniref:Protein kinase domain-containing protein n=1 Tax=Erythroxylum novogranatense TaxID=1862640 RepID=A0AAV8SGC9_9ROSI|nr:hypothetical protein K2173_016234 [Erythroxylum novogranatense]
MIRAYSMCNQGIDCLNKSPSPVDSDHYSNQTIGLMDTPTSVTQSTPATNDETARVKFLCSFSGSIMPRPQDGKLRYVGGETRIMSVPRDISYEELMTKMKELYDGVAVLKYQQPDEDLDALVSVVNDDDVTNMMEEYDKLGSGDGFTRLRIFLFPHPDQDGSVHFVDGDDRDPERRYVDALNNLNDGPEYRRQQPDSPLVGQIDDIHLQEQFFSPLSLDGGLHNQRSADVSIPQYNLCHVAIPQSQRYNEPDGAWSPAFYSPRHHGHLDPRTMSEFPSSPPARYRVQFGELPDRVPEEYTRSQLNPHPAYDHQQPFSDNLVWMPAGCVSGDRAGFPGNLLHVPGVFDSNSVCEQCRVAFPRNQIHLEQPNMGSGIPQVPNPCAECPSNREAFLLNVDPKVHHTMYMKDQNDPRSIYSETHNHDKGWVLQHQSNPQADEAKTHVSGAGRFNDHYIVDGPGLSYPLGHTSFIDAHHLSSNYNNQRASPEVGNEVFHDQSVPVPHHLHIPPPEERTVRYGNLPYTYGTESVHHISHGHTHAQALWRNGQNPISGVPFETSVATPQVNGMCNPAFVRSIVDGVQRIGSGMDSNQPWVESSQKMVAVDGKSVPESSYAHAAQNFNPNIYGPENKQLFLPGTISPTVPCEIRNSAPSCVSTGNPESNITNASVVAITEEKSILGIETEESLIGKVEKLDQQQMPSLSQSIVVESNGEITSLESINSNHLKHVEERVDVLKVGEKDLSSAPKDSNLSGHLSFLPELIASVKKAALEEAEEIKARVEEVADPLAHNSETKEANIKEFEQVTTHEEPELDLDADNVDINKIEPTKAEAEAIARGLQTIKNDDLEEIRELGSGTYGAVYHGKWKGSDVAIKRIKASCFAGRPSERERLIADFWKEALLLSSLHHPNVVSFYGIVRDGPDGTLATVTEFMINGSLKQFLQKKDRTIDRRKRLIIAMDAAFGMEYLHGKNIVHFDLKCENLLVNMRDPQRPICKIGDLGLSKVKQHTLVSGGVRGTLPWMAPELLSGKNHMVSEKIDVYSFGIVMWELLTGEEPYADLHCASIIGGIVNNSLRPQIPTWCDPEWKSLMESCWASDPAERPSFSEISRRLRNMAAAINVK